MKSVFISHASVDKPFVFRLAFELLGEGVPVWLDRWEMGPGDPLIASLDKALDGSARVVVVVSRHAAETKWVQYEVEKALEAESRIGQRLLVPLQIDDSAGLDALKGRVHVNLREGPSFMVGVHALIDHLRSLGLSSEPSGRCVLPLVFHRRIELDTFVLQHILMRWIGEALAWSAITPEMLHLVKSDEHNRWQRDLRARISTHWGGPDATAEGLDVLRTLDADVVRRERKLLENVARILREFGYGFGLGNSHVIDVVRWYTRVAMHDLMLTLEAAHRFEGDTTNAFSQAITSLPAYRPEPSTAEWWKIEDPVTVPVHHQDGDGRYHTTGSVLVPRSALRVAESEFEHYPGVAFRGAFQFEALHRFVLPQLVEKASSIPYGPAAWDQDRFRIWRHRD